MKVPFKQVDVFTKEPFRGNPVAVVLDAQGLSTEEMQGIANWTNLSETTFVLPPTHANADYRVRFFTPRAELTFAGHPTLGTAHALLDASIIKAKGGKLTQECAAGLVSLIVTPVDSGSPVIAFQLPSPSYQHLSEEQVRDLESILGSPVLHTPNPKFINVGPNWAIVQLSSAAAILALQPDMARLAAFNQQTNSTGVVVFGPHGENEAAAIEVRTFAPFHGVNEDPVCGSGNGAVAAFLRESKQIRKFGSTYISSQGAVVGRNGRIFIALDGDESIRVGGQCVTCIDGVIVQPR